MRRCNSSLMRSQQPAFQQACNSVTSWQQVLPDLRIRPYDVVFVAKRRQSVVAGPSVSVNTASRFDGLLDSTVQTFSRGVRDSLQPDAPNMVPIVLCRNYYQRFPHCSSSPLAGFLSPYVCFVHVNGSCKTVAPRSNHGSAKLMQPSPSGLIATHSKHTFKAQSTRTILLAGNVPHGPEPQRQRQTAVLKDSPRSDRHLATTTAAQKQPPAHRPRLIPATLRAYKAVGPTEIEQVAPAQLIRGKPALQFQQRSWIIFHDYKHYRIGLVESSGYPHKRIRRNRAS